MVMSQAPSSPARRGKGADIAYVPSSPNKPACVGLWTPGSSPSLSAASRRLCHVEAATPRENDYMEASLDAPYMVSCTGAPPPSLSSVLPPSRHPSTVEAEAPSRGAAAAACSPVSTVTAAQPARVPPSEQGDAATPLKLVRRQCREAGLTYSISDSKEDLIDRLGSARHAAHCSLLASRIHEALAFVPDEEKHRVHDPTAESKEPTLSPARGLRMAQAAPVKTMAEGDPACSPSSRHHEQAGHQTRGAKTSHPAATEVGASKAPVWARWFATLAERTPRVQGDAVRPPAGGASPPRPDRKSVV